MNELIDGSTMLIEFKTTGLTKRATNINNTVVTYGHPKQTFMVMDSLKTCGVWIRHQWIFDKAKPLSVSTSKTRNNYRDSRNGRRRLTPLEVMKLSHSRGIDRIKTAKKEKKILMALHALLQTAQIFFNTNYRWNVDTG